MILERAGPIVGRLVVQHSDDAADAQVWFKAEPHRKSVVLHRLFFACHCADDDGNVGRGWYTSAIGRAYGTIGRGAWDILAVRHINADSTVLCRSRDGSSLCCWNPSHDCVQSRSLNAFNTDVFSVSPAVRTTEIPAHGGSLRPATQNSVVATGIITRWTTVATTAVDERRATSDRGAEYLRSLNKIYKRDGVYIQERQWTLTLALILPNHPRPHRCPHLGVADTHT